MTVATKPAERIALAPVQRRVENHMDLRLERQAATHDNVVELIGIGREDAADAREARMERFHFAALLTVLNDPWASPAQRTTAAEQYRAFWIREDDAEDAEREDRRIQKLRQVARGLDADAMHADYITACTGERPDPIDGCTESGCVA